MSTDILKFGVSTPTVSIENELPVIEAMDLVLELAPDFVEASEAIEIMGTPHISSGRYDGEGWSVWFVRLRPTLH